MNLHVGMDTFGGINNPINAAAMKESELLNVKFSFGNEDDEHIYDDPNLLLDANGSPVVPVGYSAPKGTPEAQAKVDMGAGSKKQPPSNAAMCGSGCGREQGNKAPTEPRYAPLYSQFQQSSSSGPYMAASPPHSTFLPPGYASPKSSQIYHECMPPAEEEECPNYDDCVPKPRERPQQHNYKNIAVLEPKEKPELDSAPQTADSAPLTPQRYNKLVHNTGAGIGLPPGYASPKFLGVLASQDEPEKVDLAGGEATVSSFKPQAQPQEVKTSSGETGSGEGKYFRLKRESMQKESAYQELSEATVGVAPGGGDGGAPSHEQEDDQYMVMGSVTVKIPKPLQ